MSRTFRLMGETEGQNRSLFTEFRGPTVSEWTAAFPSAPDPAGGSAVDSLREVLRWWGAAGLAVFGSPHEAALSEDWLSRRLSQTGQPSPLLLPWIVRPASTRRATPPCAWWQDGGIDHRWGGASRTDIVVSAEGSDRLWKTIETLCRIATSMHQGTLAVIDAYAVYGPGLDVLRTLATKIGPQHSQTAMLVFHNPQCPPSGKKPVHWNDLKLPDWVRPFTPDSDRREDTEPGFHDRFIGVLAQDRSERRQRLVTAVFAGQGLQTLRDKRPKVAVYGRVSGKPLEQLEGVLGRFRVGSA